jgi:tRNA threonylcarbamoyladenosine biosynthesis protein TsaE
MIISVSDLSALPAAARTLLSAMKDQKVFLFHGEMGAGKTTFIKAICAELGVATAVSSPTFALVNEYEYPGGLIYHFDCYRLKKANEALDFGLEEYLDSGHYCFIEWPEKIAEFWPASYVDVYLSTLDEHLREIRLELKA